MALPSGTRLGPYEIRAPLGAGGMGDVYRALDVRLGREVAVKVLPPDLAQDHAARARFEREARAVAALSHPNILSINDVGEAEGLSFAVTELLEGETLHARVSRSALPWRRGVEIGAALAEGLAAAHEKGVIHRDLKPENIFLTSDGRLKILDFGLARDIHVSKEHASGVSTGTQPGVVLGTVGYMSPEQVRGEAAKAPSDIFSLGCVLYEMISGRRAFAGGSAAETLAAILNLDPPLLSRSVAEVIPELERLIWRCLEKRPEERFQSARDLAFTLQVPA